MYKVTARILVCALVASIATAILPTRSLAATPDDLPEVGVQFHAMWSDYTDAQRLAVVDKMADAGLEVAPDRLRLVLDPAVRTDPRTPSGTSTGQTRSSTQLEREA